MYYSRASLADRIDPNTLRGPIEVILSPGATHPDGHASEGDPLGPWVDDVYIGVVEATWELTIRGVRMPGRYLLRGGAFIGLEWEAPGPPMPGGEPGRPA